VVTPSVGRVRVTKALILAISSAVLAVAAVVTLDRERPAPAQVVDDPNVVFVMADDLRPADLEQVADLKPNGGFDWVRDNGVRFDTYVSTDNLCCPGRTTALTGKTAYNHGVFSNNERNTPQANLQSKSLPLWMQKDNYCTGFTGKYHITRPTTRPAGWTYWEPLAGDAADEYGYGVMRRNGSVWKPGDFITDRIASVTRAQLTDCLNSGKPAFAALWPVAPHFGSDPEPTYANTPIAWSNDDPSFNEADITDKPPWLQAWYPQPKPNAESYYSTRHTTRIRSLLSVDDALDSIVDLLASRGDLGNTIVVLTGDNGWLMGEHRVNSRKRLAYEAAQTGLWIAGPGFPVGTTSDAFATNLDLVPTLVHATGRAIPASSDGRPLQSVLKEGDRGHDRFLPIFVPVETADVARQPVGDAVRTWRFKYVRYADGSEELYDLFADPYEQANFANAGGLTLYVKVAMQNLLATAKACSGAPCRASAPVPLRG
jgi:N-acetylglucosamine-6-sulfatase